MRVSAVVFVVSRLHSNQLSACRPIIASHGDFCCQICSCQLSEIVIAVVTSSEPAAFVVDGLLDDAEMQVRRSPILRLARCCCLMFMMMGGE